MAHQIEISWPTDAVAQISFSDPARGNQICWAAIDALADALQTCRTKGARVVILASGLAGHWLEHAWLQDLADGAEGLPQTGSGSGWFATLKALADPEMISIAAISGDSSGGGAELGWACDLRIAEQQARFAQIEVNLGLTTGIGGSCRLARLAGRSTAAQMVLTGRPQSAERLYQLGAINEVVARGEATARALELGRALADKPAPALRGLKQILALNDETPLTDALHQEQAIFQSVLAGDQARATLRQVQSQYDSGHSTAELNHYDETD